VQNIGIRKLEFTKQINVNNHNKNEKHQHLKQINKQQPSKLKPKVAKIAKIKLN